MKNQFFILSIVLIFVLIIIYIYYTNNYETFDARITGLTKTKCGHLCTSILGCHGFSYSDDNKCYLSKMPILSKSPVALFTDEYKTENYRCNKLQPIQDETDLITPELLKRNSLYTCSKTEQGDYDLNIISEKLDMPVSNFNEIDKINIPEYKIISNFKFPKNKQDSVLSDIYNTNEFKLYEKSKNDYNGEYLFDHKCDYDINEQSCLKMCDIDNRCIGTEWNPYFMKATSYTDYEVYKNVCCPKKNITNIIPRRKEIENGAFYIKRNTDNLDKNIIYTINS